MSDDIKHKLSTAFNSGFNSMSKENQINLIKIYFPIGLKVSLNDNFNLSYCFFGYSNSGVVTGYKEIYNSNGEFNVYNIIIEGDNPGSCEFKMKFLSQLTSAHPALFIYTREDMQICKRNNKIKALLDGLS